MLVVVKALLAVALVAASWWRLRFSSGPRIGLTNLMILNASAAAWCLASIWAEYGDESDRLLGAAMVLVISASATAAVLVSWQVSRPTLYPPRWAVTVLAAAPAALTVLTLAGVGVSASSYRRGPLYLITTTYCVTLVMLSLSLLARRLGDEDPIVRRSMPGFQVLILVIAVTEIRDLNIACVFTSVAALGVLWASTKHSPWLGDPSRYRSILDQIGAFVFVFDRFGRLSAWNDPAAKLVTDSGRPPLRVGLSAPEVIGLDVPLAGRHVVKFDSPSGVVNTVGYTTQPPANGLNDDRGWVVVLRRSGNEERPRVQRPVLQPDHRDETTGTLGRAAVIERLRRTFASRENIGVIRVDVVGSMSDEDADTGMRQLAEGLESTRAGLVIGRIERLAFAVLLPDATEASEMSARIRSRFDEFEERFGASLSVTALVSSKDEAQDDFVRKVLTPPELIERVRWQPRWY